MRALVAGGREGPELELESLAEVDELELLVDLEVGELDEEVEELDLEVEEFDAVEFDLRSCSSSVSSSASWLVSACVSITASSSSAKSSDHSHWLYSLMTSGSIIVPVSSAPNPPSPSSMCD